ncbi:hypothetical protein [Chitinophaga eiseniae]|nr:hypothetical protein [Chitinophaga eiseniae]
MISAAKDIAQMFAYRFFIREYDYVSGMVSVDYFINDVKSNIAHWSHWTGFTEQQIINSLEKLKAK